MRACTASCSRAASAASSSTCRRSFEIMATIARGCPSTGWVLALTAGHAHTLAALFAEATQVEIFGADGEYRAPLSGNGSGDAYARRRWLPTDGWLELRVRL